MRAAPRQVTWTWARVPFGPTRRRQAAVDVPLSTGRPGPSQVVSPRRPAMRRRLPRPAGPGTRSAERVLAPPILASRDTVWRPRTPSVPAVDVGELSGYSRADVNTRADLHRRRESAGQTLDPRSRPTIGILRKY